MIKLVFSDSARKDCDNLMFNGDKTALYHQVVEIEDLTYGTKNLSYTTYTLPINGNIANSFTTMVRQGFLAEGDATGVLRYEYTQEADETAISPTLYPKITDEFTFMGTRFRISKLTPQMSEDHQIILFTFESKPVSTGDELNFPLTFPIQF